MRRISLILLVACTLAVPASGQTAPQQPVLHYETASAPTVRPDATAAINPFDRFLMMTGTATLGAGVGTGLMWGAFMSSGRIPTVMKTMMTSCLRRTRATKMSNLP
jgi:hypothetical protein